MGGQFGGVREGEGLAREMMQHWYPDQWSIAMPTHHPLFHDVFERISQTVPDLRKSGRTRLALLVSGILAARSCVQLTVATELLCLEFTEAHSAESIARRLRRTLADPRLEPSTCYSPALPTILDWEAVRAATGRAVLILDESTADDRMHLLRLALAYRGGALPLAWAAWEQNVPQPPGAYWQTIETLLSQAAALLPPDLDVVVLADRAYDIPPLLDRLSGRGWHWIIRLKTRASTRFRDTTGVEGPVSALLRRRLRRRGWRCTMRGQLFKDAGWRDVSLVGLWATREDEALVVISDLPATYELLLRYRQRFWIEAAFRNDKGMGWHWEDCQVRELAQQQVLLLALAWATLVTLCLGSERAEQELRERITRPARRPQPARFSLFTLGLQALRTFLHHPHRWHLRWLLPALDAPAWNTQWLTLQRQQWLAQTVRP
jgi:hypothetical protein